jgi:Polysaccharide pyruvyl transferase
VSLAGVRVLVTGWFSFDEVIATVGDELGADTVVRWLRRAGVAHDVAWAPYLGRGVDWRDVDPRDYTHLVFVSGPISDRPLLRELSATFAHARRWAVNVSVVDEAGRALFDEVRERDAPPAGGRPGVTRPDLALDGAPEEAPVVAVAFAPPQGEYGERSTAERVRQVIEEWLADRQLPWFELGMDLFDKPHPRRPAQVEALIGRADVVVSMRLHALVLGLKHGRPVVACDPVAGGAKVTGQAAALGWPLVLPGESLTAASLDAALARALSGDLAGAVAAAGDAGRAGVADTADWFRARLTG